LLPITPVTYNITMNVKQATTVPRKPPSSEEASNISINIVSPPKKISAALPVLITEFYNNLNFVSTSAFTT
jgi:hypothetical protein